MGWKLSNLPGGEDFEKPVEQATAAPGEKRAVALCHAGSSQGHGCQKPLGHTGPHRYEWD